MARRPHPAAIVATLAGIAVFVSLGLWQLRRAHEKEALFAAFDGAARQPPASLEQARLAEGMRYPLVEVTGRFDPAHAYVLDNQVRGGRAGVIVYDVFEPSTGGAAVLVARGFLARDAHGAMPTIPPPPEGARTLRALYAPAPGSGLRLGGDALPHQTRWPKTTIYLDPAEVAADLGRPLDTRVLLQLPGEEVTTFVREWKPEVFPPERHYGYAFTWFTFAAVVAATFFILHRPPRRREDHP
ncbi:SURF1 family protein [Dokdonella fugitiva]|jgi:cytochrome oxidase assembly protein ShyY1|uniref:SURF1 family protein n=1 Tax=Dokdonella fugitiva TaxID=328517 RepID=UPI0015F9C139|nr:SURF1 family protein [Dokdonella fugitiva]MBA8883489.1 cytochrome oxidase assembly protein ShyY1 [Dokdonella fugitiva]